MTPLTKVSRDRQNVRGIGRAGAAEAGRELPAASTQQPALWWITKDGDDRARTLFDRHYSRYHYADGRKPRLFCGPGEKLVLSTWEGDALWVWRKFIDASGQLGINCAIFRNESPHKASELVRQADAIADHCWPGERHYTYVDARRIRSTNPGCCFKMAGWRECGRTKKRGFLILERQST